MFLHRRKTELLLLIAISSSTSPQVSAFTTISIPTCRQSLALQTFTSRVEEESLLEDGEGHINRELAERIWNWEQQKRQDKNLPKFPYSTRGGLRMVNDIVHELMVVGGKGVNADDLVQEGVIALLDCMNRFDYNDSETFEKFARAHIHEQLVQSLKEAPRTSGSLSSSPSSQAARRRPNKALSVESTVEIDDPIGKYYSNEDEWEVEEGLVLDNGHELKKEELVEDFLDESLIYEGDDQMWVHQNQVYAPLRDSIPDQSTTLTGDPSPDDSALKDMIRYDAGQFLGSTLTELEANVIRLKYGLIEDGKASSSPKTKRQVAETLKMSLEELKQVQKSALEKLRNAYAAKFLKDDDAEENYYEDTA